LREKREKRKRERERERERGREGEEFCNFIHCAEIRKLKCDSEVRLSQVWKLP